MGCVTMCVTAQKILFRMEIKNMSAGSNRGLATNIICSSGDPRRKAVC
jgi:hypothetical protein